MANVIHVAPYILSFCVIVLAATARSDAASPTTMPVAATVRVMSFNVRYGTADDGLNRWPLRRDLLVRTIKTFDPDLLGTQETLLNQAEFLAESLPDYRWLGVGRDDGKLAGESVAIYFKKDRFEKLDGGHIWLSETPDVAGSKSWDASLTRMATWVTLRDRKSGERLLWLNTHFDHRGRTARLESAKLIRRWVLERHPDLPLIVTGDFNDVAGGAPHEALVGGDVDGPKWTDAFAKANPAGTGDELTFHAFKGGRKGSRIDWIVCSDAFDVVRSEIDRTSDKGRFPSDHYAVTAVLKLAHR